MRVCTMIEWCGPNGSYSLVSPEHGIVAIGFLSEADAVEYAIEQGWEVF